MSVNYFAPFTTLLHPGTNLIEASAGTGKTYAIAMMVLRFIVEHDISIDQLLIVTFTKAATEELKERIRSKLTEAQKALINSPTDADQKIIDYLKQLPLATEQIQKRLNHAILSIDQANIFTIHGFCHHVLNSCPLESGQLFNNQLIDDITPIKQQGADDFWRQTIYAKTPWEAAILTATYKTPEELLASIAYLPEQVPVYPTYPSLTESLANLKQQAALALDAWPQVLALQQHISDDKFKTRYSTQFINHATALKTWLDRTNNQAPSKETYTLLTRVGLQDNLNGNKFRANKTQSSDERKQDYLNQLAFNTTAFDQLADAVKQIDLTLRGNLIDYLRAEVNKQLQQRHELSFDQLITRLADALQQENSNNLIQQLRQTIKVALIDEFQDTDDTQWTIFKTLFATNSHYLYLIGDPKQAIYKFRGADIYTYLAAKHCADHHFTLSHNWRSHPDLVAAVNVLFQRQNAFFLSGLNFTPVQAGLAVAEGGLYKEQQALPTMLLWQLPPSDTTKGYWRSGEASTAISNAIINEIVQLLSLDYRFAPNNRRLQPKDIAILVRTNRQAREYQAALRNAHIPSVLNSMESVFTTPEATDLHTLLQAITNPGNTDLFKQAMTLSWFALNGQKFYQFINDDNAINLGMGRFLAYFQTWQKAGLMTMMLNVMAEENIKVNLSTGKLAERQLTNLQHLLELVQQAAVEQHLTPNKTIIWLHQAITQANSQENQQLRLESDDNAVKIVTTHRSKGLEYNIVFCPYLWQRNSRDTDLVLCHENGKMLADIGSDYFLQRKQQALNEELAEDLRLLYVAVTRAKYRCYLAWVDVRTENLTNQSAMAWLLDFAEDDFAAQQNKLQTLTDNFPSSFAYHLLDINQPVIHWQIKAPSALTLQAQIRRRALHTARQMSSYTALSELTQPASSEQFTEITLETVDRIPELALLPKGAQTGNVVHALLEQCSFQQLAKQHDITNLRTKICLRFGLKLEQPDMLDALLQTIVSTPLSEIDSDFCLKHVDNQQCVKEMPFYLALRNLNTAAINNILSESPSFQPLTNKQIAGFLTGFIDLVCLYQGRYYVMDYKTNVLADYRPEALIQAMSEHNYGLQYWLYSLVLHRYLQQRLPNYNYAQHFGGVRYLFVRGMQPDRLMHGVFQDRPALKTLEALAELFLL